MGWYLCIARGESLHSKRKAKSGFTAVVFDEIYVQVTGRID